MTFKSGAESEWTRPEIPDKTEQIWYHTREQLVCQTIVNSVLAFIQIAFTHSHADLLFFMFPRISIETHRERV